MSGSALKPAAELARGNSVRFPNESAEYRRARAQLLAEEIELRRHIERVAELRRTLPPGGAVTKNYEFEGEDGRATLPDLFGNKQALVIYSYMFGPQRERPCPMCTTLLDAWNGEAKPIGERVSLVAVARSPIAKLLAFKKERGWKDLRLVSDVNANRACSSCCWSHRWAKTELYRAGWKVFGANFCLPSSCCWESGCTFPISSVAARPKRFSFTRSPS